MRTVKDEDKFELYQISGSAELIMDEYSYPWSFLDGIEYNLAEHDEYFYTKYAMVSLNDWVMTIHASVKVYEMDKAQDALNTIIAFQRDRYNAAVSNYPIKELKGEFKFVPKE
jgi:hypothetical protein